MRTPIAPLWEAFEQLLKWAARRAWCDKCEAVTLHHYVKHIANEKGERLFLYQCKKCGCEEIFIASNDESEVA